MKAFAPVPALRACRGFGGAQTAAPRAPMLATDRVIRPTAQGNRMSKPDVHVATMKLQLDELNLKMAEVETRVADARDDARTAHDDEMVKLREHSRAAGAQFNAPKAA